jgi:hypothetical protein
MRPARSALMNSWVSISGCRLTSTAPAPWREPPGVSKPSSPSSGTTMWKPFDPDVFTNDGSASSSSSARTASAPRRSASDRRPAGPVEDTYVRPVEVRQRASTRRAA